MLQHVSSSSVKRAAASVTEPELSSGRRSHRLPSSAQVGADSFQTVLHGSDGAIVLCIVMKVCYNRPSFALYDERWTYAEVTFAAGLHCVRNELEATWLHKLEEKNGHRGITYLGIGDN